MEEFITQLLEHIYEIAVGIAVVVGTFLNKPKTPKQIKAKREKDILKCEKNETKLIEKLKANARKKDELEKENNNAGSN